MGIKKSALSAKNLKKVSGPGSLASELQNKADKSGVYKVAKLEWDFVSTAGEVAGCAEV